MDNLNGGEAAFSIGNIVEIGFRIGIKPKDWYGPSTVIQILDELNTKHVPFPGLATAAFPEGVIYKSTILSKACGLSSEGLKKITGSLASYWKNATIVLVGFRVGLDAINPENYDAIFRMFNIPHCVGMVGGQGRGALYFVGYQDHDLLFIDPHVTQAPLPLYLSRPLSQRLWICGPNTKAITSVCPSNSLYRSLTPVLPTVSPQVKVGLGFYLRTYADYEAFVQVIKKEQEVPGSFVVLSEKENNCEEDDLIDI